MKNIIKKSARAIWRNKKSYAACIAVLGIGMMIYISMLSVMDALKYGIEEYYEETNFADVFATLDAMPTDRMNRLYDIEGIEAVQGVLSQDMKVVMDNTAFIVKLKLIGAQSNDETSLNQYSYNGYPLTNQKDIWLGEEFADAYALQLGDAITLRINGKEESFTVCGTVTSPEYIYVVEENAVISNAQAYTIGFVQQSTIEELLGMQGMVTEISFSLQDGYIFEDVEHALEEALQPYGLKSLVKRADQASNSGIEGEINELIIMGTVVPIIFLTASVIMMYILLKRMVEQERSEIGTLKAFGFQSAEILAGYFINGMLCGALAFILGLLIANPFGSYMYDMYKDFFSLPNPYFSISRSIAIKGILIAIGVSLVAVWFGSNAVLKIHPAEAMRAAAPVANHSGISLNSKWLQARLGQKGNMVLRSITRNKLRAALTVLCIAFAFSMMNVIVAMRASILTMIDGQTTLSEVYDIKATLQAPQYLDTLVHEADALDGVSYAEGLLAMSVTLTNESKHETVAIYGVAEDATLFNIRDTSGNFHAPSRNGLMLSSTLAEKLGVQTGDILELDNSYLSDSIIIPVSLVFEEPMGIGCYMEISALSSLFTSRVVANSILLSVDTDLVSSVQETLIDAGNVTSVVNQAQVNESNQSMLENMNTMIGMFILMSFLMALGSVYSISRITLTEKQRELATMRVLGFSVNEVYSIHTYEQWIAFFLAICFGMILSLFLKEYIANLFNNDNYTMKISLSLLSSTVAFLGCSAAMTLTNKIAKKEIAGYALADVLKERE